MTEPISGVITLITASLVVIRETRQFIQETREVDTELKRRSAQLESLEQYVLVVEKQCSSGIDLGEDVPRIINDSLSSLKPKLEELQKIVRDQASRGCDTLYKRLRTQIHMKLSQRDVNSAMQELAHHQSVMALSVNLGILQLAMNIDRRTSDASPTVPTFQSPFPQTDLPFAHDVKSSKPRTLSNDSTVYEPRVAAERKPSVATHASLRSHHSTSSSDGRTSFSTESQLPGQEIDTASDLHYHINHARDSQSRLQTVRQIVEGRSDRTQVIERKDQYGRTPLFAAVKIGDINLVRAMILEFGADINAMDNRPYCVLEYALSLPKKRDAVVEFLIERGADQKSVTSKEHCMALREIIRSTDFRREQAEEMKRKEAKQKAKQMNGRKFSFGSKKRQPP